MHHVKAGEPQDTGGLVDMDMGMRRDGEAVVREKGKVDEWGGEKYGRMCEELMGVELQAGEWVRWRDDDERGAGRTEGVDGMDLDSVVSLQDAYPCGQR